MEGHAVWGRRKVPPVDRSVEAKLRATRVLGSLSKKNEKEFRSDKNLKEREKELGPAKQRCPPEGNWIPGEKQKPSFTGHGIRNTLHQNRDRRTSVNARQVRICWG